MIERRGEQDVEKNDIEVINFTKKYGKFTAVDNISFNVTQSNICGFIGPNGAGKTTTINTISNLLFPNNGEVLVFGRDVTREIKEIKKNMRVLFSEDYFYKNLSGMDNLLFIAELHKIPRDDAKRQIREYADKLGLDLKKKANDLSRGNKRKLSVVSALLGEPKLLILDEPTTGLDPLIQIEMFNLIKEVNREQGTTIFFSSHILSEVQNICVDVIFIKEGIISKTGKIESLLQKEILLEYANEQAALRNFGLIKELKTDAKHNAGGMPSVSYKGNKINISPSNVVEFNRLLSLNKFYTDKDLVDISIKSKDLESVFILDYQTGVQS